MAIEILQLNSDHEFYETEFQLDGETFRLVTRWNSRIDSWILSLYDFEGNPIHTGRRLTVGNFLFPWLSSQSRPAGQLMALDTKDEDHDPGHDDLGDRIIVYYLDAEEVEELIAEAVAEGTR